MARLAKASTPFYSISLPYLGGNNANPLLAGIISYWRFQDTSYVDDVQGNNLTSGGGASIISTGLIGNAAGLNGTTSNGVLYHADTASLAAGAGVSFTLNCWVAYNGGYPSSLVMGKWDKTNNDFAIRLDADNLLYFCATDTNGVVQQINAGVRLANSAGFNVFTLVSAGYDAAQKAIWMQINGGARIWLNCPADIQRTSAAFTFGNYGTSGGTPMKATFDEASFYHRSLSADEVNLLYNAGAGNQWPFHGTVVAGSAATIGADWSARVVANGGSALSGTVIAAANAMYAGMLADGCCMAFVMNPIAPGSLIAAQTPLIVGPGLPLWTNANFVDGDVTVNGITGNASNKLMDTGINPSLFTWLDQGLAVYVKSATGAFGVDFGCNNATYAYLIVGKYGDNTSIEATGPAANQLTASPSSGAGFYLGARVSSVDHRLYFANSSTSFAQIGSTDTIPNSTIGANPSLNAQFMASNATGTPAIYSSDTVSFIACVRGMSSAKGQKFFNRVQAFRVAVGGGSV